MLKKIFSITSLILLASITSFNVFAAEETTKTEKVTEPKKSTIERLKSLELAEEAPAPRPVTAAPSNIVWWALGFGIAGFLGLVLAIVAISLVERLRRRIAREAPEPAGEPQVEPAPEEKKEIRIEPDPADEAGFVPPLFLVILAGIFAVTLALTPVVMAKKASQTEFLKALREAIVETAAKADNALVEAQNAQTTADNAAKAAADAKKTAESAQKAVDAVKKVDAYTKKQVRTRFVELPKYAKKGWAARQAKVSETTLVALLILTGQPIAEAQKTVAEFVKNPLAKGADQKILGDINDATTTDELARWVETNFATVNLLNARDERLKKAINKTSNQVSDHDREITALMNSVNGWGNEISGLQNDLSENFQTLDEKIDKKADASEIEEDVDGKLTQLRSEFGTNLVELTDVLKNILSTPQKVEVPWGRDGRTIPLNTEELDRLAAKFAQLQ